MTSSDWNDPYKTRPTTVVAVGKTGKGKSTTLNSLLKAIQKSDHRIKVNYFESHEGPDSVTSDVSSCEVTPPGYAKCRLVDTIGLFDTQLTKFDKDKLTFAKMSCVDEEHRLVLEQFVKVIQMCKDGIDAFLFVVKATDRASKEEMETIEIIFRYLGWNMLDYVIFVVTGKDEASVKSFQGWQTHICNVLQTRGYPKERVKDRFFFVDNKHPSIEQAYELLTLIQYVRDLNKGQPYTAMAFDAAQVELEREKARIKADLEKQMQDKIDTAVKPIKEKHQQEMTNLQNQIKETEAAAAQLRADQIKERKENQARMADLKTNMERKKAVMEMETKAKLEQLEREKRETYEKERNEMSELFNQLRQDMQKKCEEINRRLAAAQANAEQRRGKCLIL